AQARPQDAAKADRLLLAQPRRRRDRRGRVVSLPGLFRRLPHGRPGRRTGGARPFFHFATAQGACDNGLTVQSCTALGGAISWREHATATARRGGTVSNSRLAGLAHKLAVIRSIRHDQGNHGAGNHYMMTGAPPRIPVGCGAFVSFHPSLGSVTARERGAPAGLPAYFSMPEMSRSGGPNFLGAEFAPFVVSDNPNSLYFRVRDVALPRGLTGERFLERCDQRKEVDTFQRILDKTANDPALAFD